MDEFGYLPFEPAAAHVLFQLVSRRYERGSIPITSNRAVGDWGTVLGDQVVATAILDRLLHHCHVLPFAATATGCAKSDALWADQGDTRTGTRRGIPVAEVDGFSVSPLDGLLMSLDSIVLRAISASTRAPFVRRYAQSVLGSASPSTRQST